MNRSTAFVLSWLPGLALVGIVAGCSILAPQADKVARGAGDLVNYYCQNVTDASVRQQIRDAVNKYAAPNSVVVTCAQGGEPLIVQAVPIPPK